MMRRDQADLCAAHAGGCMLRNPYCAYLNAAPACAVCADVRSMAWAGAVARVIVGLPVEPRAGPESFSEQSPDTRRESR